MSATCTAATICPQIHTTGHIETKKAEPQFLRCWRYLRMLHCPNVRIAIVLDDGRFPTAPHEGQPLLLLSSTSPRTLRACDDRSRLPDRSHTAELGSKAIASTEEAGQDG